MYILQQVAKKLSSKSSISQCFVKCRNVHYQCQVKLFLLKNKMQ